MKSQRPPTLRERKKAQTRQALVRAAYTLFRERGFEQVTVDEIADAADVSRSTFFRYFTSKEAVVFPNHEERLAALRAMVMSPEPGETPFGTVRRAVIELARRFNEERESTLDQFQVMSTSPALLAYELGLDQKWEGVFQDAFARNTNDLWEPRIAAGAVFGAVRSTVRWWIEGGCAEDAVEIATRTLDILEAGVALVQSQQSQTGSSSPS